MTAMVLMLACNTVRPQCKWPFHGHWLSAAHSLNMNTFLKSALSVALAVLASYSTAAPAHSSAAARWLEAHRDRPPMLRQFVQRMPKGADLHSHLSGAVYAETYLRLAAEGGLCVNAQTVQFAPPDAAGACQTPNMPAGKITSALYSAMVNKLSTRNVALSGKNGHDQFFSTFSGFRLPANLPNATVAMAAEVSNRAASQHIQHLELMATFQGEAVRALADKLPWSAQPDFANAQAWLQANGLDAVVEAARRDLDQFDQGYRAAQACGGAQAQGGCQVSLRWLQQTSRTAAPNQVFAQLAFAFALASADARVVGLNLVAPEDDPVALRDYQLHMRMIGWLSKQWPTVNVALHAGELTQGLTPPETLRHHIRDAVEIAGAKRIGHGVAIGYEDHAAQTLAIMRARRVAVEVCLTSNDVILGVSGKHHPLPTYLAAGVPVTLASDDEGVSRIDLSHEYLRAAQTYQLNYAQLKQLSRNSLEYSFLPGESLWRNLARSQVIAVCSQDAPGAKALSPRCAHALGSSEKAQRQWQLEAAFREFERDPLWRMR